MAKSSGSILLVDDDEGFRHAATKVLEEAGFAVAAAPDYRHATRQPDETAAKQKALEE